MKRPNWQGIVLLAVLAVLFGMKLIDNLPVRHIIANERKQRGKGSLSRHGRKDDAGESGGKAFHPCQLCRILM